MDTNQLLFYLACVLVLVLAIDHVRARLSSTYAKKDRTGGLLGFSRAVAPICVIALLFRSLIAEPYKIPTPSMEPTLPAGDWVVVTRYDFNLALPFISSEASINVALPSAGDIVAFDHPKKAGTRYVKRIVGIPGDRVEYRNKQLFINGQLVAEERLQTDGTKTDYDLMLENVRHTIRKDSKYKNTKSEGTWEVPPDHYFVLGDNRDASSDSRFWGFVPTSKLLGKIHAL
ncbi:MAG: signal peptidase I [Oleiphilus sp.]|nr:MAG: signal peptidase I [Oleiphilus sp.]